MVEAPGHKGWRLGRGHPPPQKFFANLLEIAHTCTCKGTRLVGIDCLFVTACLPVGMYVSVLLYASMLSCGGEIKTYFVYSVSVCIGRSNYVVGRQIIETA